MKKKTKQTTKTAALVMPCQLREVQHVEAGTVQSCEGCNGLKRFAICGLMRDVKVS